MLTSNQTSRPPLNICIVSNYYPPHFIGGYELGCREIAEALKARGHRVRVLTSTYGVEEAQDDGEVFRWLKAESWWTPDSIRSSVGVVAKEIANRRAFRRFCKRFNPDLIYVFNPTGISLSIVTVAERMDLPICYLISDHWLQEWKDDLGYQMWEAQPVRFERRLLWKSLLFVIDGLGLLVRPPVPRFKNLQFVSESLRKLTLGSCPPNSDSRIIYWGIDTEAFPFSKKSRSDKRLLYVGQVAAHKGVHVAVEAINLLVQNGHANVTLTIAGHISSPEYENTLRQMISSYKLGDNVRLKGRVSRQDISDIYEAHDILIFPSVWEEPFSITLLEAMSSGLAVVGTTTGGSREILQDGQNALVFRNEDPEDCARAIARLFANPELFETIRRNGRRTIEQKHRIQEMVDNIENSLREAVLTQRL
jgi:glycosyltransferase involved in cell wall biosynthesis